jgi:hypothetical protein
MAKGGFAKVTPIVASSLGIEGACGGNLFRRYQTECFAMGVILLSITLWRFGAPPHTESTGNFGTHHAEMPYIQRSHFRRRDCTRILQYVGRRASRVAHYVVLGNPTRLALAFCVFKQPVGAFDQMEAPTPYISHSLLKRKGIHKHEAGLVARLFVVANMDGPTAHRSYPLRDRD